MDDKSLQGETVRSNDKIRLEHVATKRNLHSHDRPSPVTRQQEVTCFLTPDGKGNDDDNWRVDLDGRSVWEFDVEIRLIHVVTSKALHSHTGYLDPTFTAGEQEVTALPKSDRNDLWVISTADQQGLATGGATSSKQAPSEVPTLAEPLKWAEFHIRKDLPKLREVWQGVTLIGLLSFGAGWWVAWSVQKETISQGERTIVNVKAVNEATIQSKDAVISQQQARIEDLGREVEKLTRQLSGQKAPQDATAKSEIVVTVQVQNTNRFKVDISPVCEIGLTEIFGGRSMLGGDEEFHLLPASSSGFEQDYSIPPQSLRDYVVKFPIDDKRKLILARGAGTLRFNIWLSDGSRSAQNILGFKQETLATKKATISF